MKYWCYVLNREGRVNARETLEGFNDNEAFGTAQRYLMRNLANRSVEVWLENRYVGKIHSHYSPGHVVLSAWFIVVAVAVFLVASA
jgi:hypothetical protein